MTNSRFIPKELEELATAIRRADKQASRQEKGKRMNASKYASWKRDQPAA